MKRWNRTLATALLLAVLLTGCGKKTVQNGQMTDDVYSNAYLGVSCALDETWTCELFEDDSENVDEYGIKEMDFRAACDDGIKSMDISYIRLEGVVKILCGILREERLVEIMIGDEEMMEDTVRSFEEIGLRDVVIEKIKVSFLGKSHYARQTAFTTADGVRIYIAELFFCGLGDYSVVVSAYSIGEDQIQEVLDLFDSP